jgi:hypothetical protein
MAKMRLACFALLLVLCLCTPAAPVSATNPTPDPGGPGDAAGETMAGRLKAPDGHWYVDATQAPAKLRPAAAANSGGPDEYGYTWTDNFPLAWIDTSGGFPTNIPAAGNYAPADLGFSFKFYENSYSQVTISQYGFLTFSPDDMWNDQVPMPSPEPPNNVIAPHWAPIDEIAGYIHYLRGGSSPNRWFAAE